MADKGAAARDDEIRPRQPLGGGVVVERLCKAQNGVPVLPLQVVFGRVAIEPEVIVADAARFEDRFGASASAAPLSARLSAWSALKPSTSGPMKPMPVSRATASASSMAARPSRERPVSHRAAPRDGRGWARHSGATRSAGTGAAPSRVRRSRPDSGRARPGACPRIRATSSRRGGCRPGSRPPRRSHAPRARLRSRSDSAGSARS